VPEVTFREPFHSHGFVIEIAGTRCPVTKVSGLTVGHTDVMEHMDGGSTYVRKVSGGVVKFDNLVVERYMDGSPTDKYFADWFAEMFQLHGPSGGSSTRRHGAVIKLEHGHEVMRFVFQDAWVMNSKFTDLEAGSNNPFKQTVEIAHSGLERVV
jgi:phage tail-like protein